MPGPFRLRILHISDLHERVSLPYMSDERKRRIQVRAAERYRVFEEGRFDESLKKVQKEGKVDLVCFTGDVADWGLKEEYERAAKRLNSILMALDLPANKLFPVPGNHDINRSKVQDVWNSVRPFAIENQDTASRHMSGELNTFRGQRLQWRDQIVQRSEAFWEWVQQIRHDPAAEALHQHKYLGYRLRVTGLPASFPPVYVIGLDSAWLAGDDNDAKKLLLTDAQIDERAVETGNTLAGLKLALVHHPLSDLADGQGSALKLKRSGIDLLLHGHQHQAIIAELQEAENRPRILAAGSLFEGDHGEKYVNNFNVIDILVNAEGAPLRFDVQFCLVSLEGDVGHREARNRRPLASKEIRVVLDPLVAEEPSRSAREGS